MEVITSLWERELTYRQAKEFLEERRGISNPSEAMLHNFMQHIYQFEADFNIHLF